MSRFSKNSAVASAWVVEVGASHVAVAEFGPGEGAKVRLQQLAMGEIPPTDQAGSTADFARAEVLDALRVALASLRPRGAVTLILPGHHAITKLVRVPAGAEAQREQLISFEAGQALPFALDELYWAHRELGNHEGECEVLVVAAKRDAVQGWVDALKGEGVEVEAVLTAGAAMLPAVPLASSGSSQAILNIGARSTHLVFQEQSRLQMRTLALAGQTVTRSIADQLDQDLGSAEQLKRGVLGGKVDLPADTPAGAATTKATESFSARLALEFKRSLVTQVRQMGMNSPQQLWLCGRGAQVSNLSADLQATGDIEVFAWTIRDACEVAPSVPPDALESDGIGWADLVGAGFARIRDLPVCDLAPPELRAGREAKRRRPRWFIAAALLVVATFLPGVHFHRLAAARTEAARDLQRSAIPVQALREQNQLRLQELDHLRAKTDILTEQVRARDAWAGLMQDLQTGVLSTGDAWLERVQMLSTAPEGVADDNPRLRISGRLLDRENPLSRVSQASFQRATALIAALQDSDHVAFIEGERFDASDPGILRFDFTLVLNPNSNL